MVYRLCAYVVINHIRLDKLMSSLIIPHAWSTAGQKGSHV